MRVPFQPLYKMLLAALCVLYCSLHQAQAAPGDLDPTFNSTGIVTTLIGDRVSSAYAVVVQPDGKIVAAGESNGTRRDFTVARYNVDGTLDPTFNGTGKVVTPIGENSFGRAVALQPDGKIVVAGQTLIQSFGNFDIAIARYNPNGTLDTSFSSDGIVITPIGVGFKGRRSGISALAIQPDGKIVAAGSSINDAGNDDFAVLRYNANGTLDTSFSSDGIVLTAIGSADDGASGVALQPDGKIVAAGSSSNGSNLDFAVVRYNANGTLDTTFNFTGKVTTSIGNFTDHASAVALQPDGRIVTAGTSFRSTNSVRDFALVRYNPNGTLDTTFNSTGIVTTVIVNTVRVSEASEVVLQPDGKIVAVGSTTENSNHNSYDFALARYNGDGTLDTSFNSNGVVTTAIGTNDDRAYGAALQPDGKIIAAGETYDGTTKFLTLARYQAFTPPNRTSVFDTDRKTDIAVWNPSNHHWYINNSSDGTQRVQLDWGSGALGDVAVPRDYDGDGRTDIAVFRPSEGNWYIIKSGDGAIMLQNWGGTGDIPVPADFDGDGRADVAVFRPTEGNWYIRNSRDQSVIRKGWGASNDKPVPADYDGDGRTDIAVYRPTDGNWYIITSRDGFGRLINWGTLTDKPVQADYDGDGRVDVAVYRPTEGTWYIRSWTNLVTVRGWGVNTDIPVPADYDADGRADIAVFRPSEGTWYIIQSATNSGSTAYLGGSGDVPAPATYLPQ